MPKIDSERFYTSAINMHGITAKGVNWSSKKSQELRFKIISKMLPKDIDSLVDAGCGFGDFYNYAQDKKINIKEYIGIDSVTDMYSIASNNTGCEILIADICNDKIPFGEYYICSGAMNVLNSFETHQFIQNCFKNCGTAFIFNILYGKKESETYNYISKSTIDIIAKNLNVKRVEILDNYMEDDITVGFFK